MANSTSTLNNYSNIPAYDLGNLELLAGGMMALEGQYLQNTQKLQDTFNEEVLMSYNVAREGDKEYFLQRLSQSKDIVNKYTSENITDPNLMSKLINKLGEAVDERVADAIVSTSIGGKEEAEWQRERKNNPEKYSDINYAVSRKKWNDYINSTDPNAVYNGGGGFVEYTDTDAVFTSKEFYDYLDKSGIRAKYIKREDGSGYFTSLNEYETIDPEKLGQAIRIFGGDKVEKQLSINAEYAFGDISDPYKVNTVKQYYEERVNKQLESTQSQIDAINTIIDSPSVTASQKEQLQQQKNALETNLNTYSKLNFDQVYNPDGTLNEAKYKNLYTNIYTNSFYEDKFNLIYHQPRLLKSEIDEVQYKTATFMETKRMNNLAFQKEAREANKQAWEMSGKPLLNPDGSYATDEDGNLVYTSADARKALGINGSVGLGGSNNLPGNINIGPGAPVTEKEAPTIAIKNEWNKDYRESVNTIVKTAGGAWNEATTTELETYLIKNTPTIGTTIKLPSGKKVNVTQENILAIDNLRTMVAGDNGAVRQLRNVLEDYSNSYKNELFQKARQDINTIPNNYLGNQYFVETGQRDAQGKKVYELKKGNISGGNSQEGNFKALVRKQNSGKPLTEAEKKTVDFYSTLSLLNNPNSGLTGFEKNQAFRQWQSKNSASTNNSIGKYEQYKTPVNDYSAVSQKADPRIASAIEVSKNIQKGATEISFRPEGKQTYSTFVENIASDTRALANRNQITVNPVSSTSSTEEKKMESLHYEAAKRELGLPSDYKGNIIFEQVFENTRPTGRYRAKIEETKDKKTSFVDWKSKDGSTISLDAVRKFVPNLVESNLTSYSVSLGNNAAHIDFNSPDTYLSNYAIGFKNAVTPEERRKMQEMFLNNFRNYYSEDMRVVLDAFQNDVRIKRGKPDFNIYKELSKKSEEFRIPSVSVVPHNESYKIIDKHSGNIVTDLKTPNLFKNDIMGIYQTQREANKIGFLKRLEDEFIYKYE